MTPSPWRRLWGDIADRRGMAGLLALLLLGLSVLLAAESERQNAAERARQVDVQARILAHGVAGALAFDDHATAREFLESLRLNGDIEAAAIYDARGTPIAGYSVRGQSLPVSVTPHLPRREGGGLSVIAPVEQGSLALGMVYVRAIVEPWPQRLSRYFGIGALIVMAALLITVLGRSYATATAANRRLQEEIAAREQAETQLRQAQKMEAIGQLTGGVAHDFNNLLMAAASGLELLQRTDDPSRRERLHRGIREALERGARLTQQLLAFSRRSPLKREVVDLRQRLAGLTDLLEHSLRADIAVSWEVAADLWPSEIDPAQFDVALLNIAVNARDAMPRAGAIRIAAANRSAALAGRDAVAVSLTDQGCGMTREQAERAFEPFFTTKGVGQGTGLGLSQVYGFVHSCDGDVSIDSTPGMSTTVTLLLPRSETPVPAETPAAGAEPGRSLAGLAVLLVEDDAALAGLLVQMLTELGCTTTHAGTADAALGMFADGRFDAVVSDMVMPGSRSGLDLARDLRRLSPGLPVLLMTGYSKAASAAREEGLAVLAKPFTMAELGRALVALQPPVAG